MKTLAFNDKFLKASIALAAFVPSMIRAEEVSCQDASDPKNLTLQGGAKCAQGSDQPSELFGDTGIFHTIANILIYIVGAVAVIMLIIGGLRYVISQGDKTNVESAKNTILYAVIGIVVAILAYAIVNFVAGSLTAGSEANQ